MSEIQQGRYDQLLRRVADLKGPGSKVNDALTELFPMFDLENVPAELLLLGGWRTAMGSAQVTAEVASTARIQLFNPVGSGHLVVVTRIDFATVTTTFIEMDTVSEPLTLNVGGNVFRDTRLGVATTAVGQIRTQLDATGLAPTWQIRSAANINHELEDHNGIAVLGPGTGLVLAPNQTNQLLVCSFFWRERVAEPSELNF